LKGSDKKIELKGYDDIFTPDAATATGEQVREIAVDQLFPFKNHPFKVLDDQAIRLRRKWHISRRCVRLIC